MAKRLFIISIILLPFTCCLLPVKAQSFLDNLRTDEQGKGKITVNESQEIDKLVRQNPVEQEPETKKPETKKPETKKPETKKPETANKQEPAKKPETKKPETANKPETKKPETAKESEEESAIDMNNKIMRGSYKTKGYRVQVYVGAGPDKRTEEKECMKAQQTMKHLFPDLPVYSHFYSPHWKCRIGNFTSLYEAQKVLKQVKAAGYRKACVVKGTISVQR